MRRNRGKEREIEKIKEEEEITPEYEMWPDLEVAIWVQEKERKEEYIQAIKEDPNYQRIYKDQEKGGKIGGIQNKEGFLYGYKGGRNGGWRLIIPNTFKIKGMSAKEFLLHEAHNNTGYGGLQKTYSYLTEYYSWVGLYQDT